MPVFALLYDYHDDSTDARDTFRPAHREFLAGLTGPVKLLATGPFVDEPAGALLIFQAESVGHVEATMDADPFAREGLIKRRQVREWTQVRGPWAD